MNKSNETELSKQTNKSTEQEIQSNRRVVIVAWLFVAFFIFIIFYEVYLSKIK